MSKKLSFSSAIIICSILHLGAADLADIPPPKPPLVANVPDRADWAIVASRVAPSTGKGNGSSVQPADLVEVHTVIFDKIKRDSLTYGDGTKTDNWFFGPIVLYKTDRGSVAAGDLSLISDADPTDPRPSVGSGFPGLAWLKLACYDKVVLKDKRPCYHYAGPGVEAWIDVETKLPLAYQKGDTIYQYTFHPAPADPLVLPPEYQKVLEKAQAAMENHASVQEKLRLRHQ